MYKCCRWCNNFSDGKCSSGAFEIDTDTGIQCIYEDGLIEEALREAPKDFDYENYYDLAKELKISKVKADKLKESMLAIFDEYLEWEAASTIKTVLTMNLIGESDVYIKNEHEFICNEFK